MFLNSHRRIGLCRVLLCSTLLTSPGWADDVVKPVTSFSYAPVFRQPPAGSDKPVPSDKDARFVGSFLAGMLWGRPTSPDIFELDIQVDGNPMFFNLQALEEAARTYSATVATSQQATLSVSPAGTHFARLGTFVYKRKPKQGYSAGFNRVSDGHYLFVFYFDRPCKLIGEDRSEEKVTVNLTIPEAGFYLLESVPGPDGGQNIVVSKSTEGVQLFVQP